MIIHYACPNCGADMTYSIRLGKLHCDHCDYSREIGPDPETFTEGADTQAVQQQAPLCPNCGAPLTAGSKTCSAKCEYCGTSVIFSDKLQGDMRPAEILPFKMDRDDVSAAFKKWCHNGRFSPKGFASADNIQNINPRYVPFWLYDLDLNASVRGTATRVRIFRNGDMETTETSFYDVSRDVTLEYRNVPYDASEELDDEIMAKVQPYNFEGLKEFQDPYLAGFMTDQRDFGSSDLLPMVRKQVDEYAEGYARSSITGYDTVNITEAGTDYRNITPRYVYLPLWFISYPYEGKEYIFAMNGQTGKVIGTPPVSKGKVALWFILISAIIYAILMLLGVLL